MGIESIFILSILPSLLKRHDLWVDCSISVSLNQDVPDIGRMGRMAVDIGKYPPDGGQRR